MNEFKIKGVSSVGDYCPLTKDKCRKDCALIYIDHGKTKTDVPKRTCSIKIIAKMLNSLDTTIFEKEYKKEASSDPDII